MSYYQINHKWFEANWAKQCSKSAKYGTYKCQGAEGHGGDCWCYKPNGPLVLIIDEQNILEIDPQDEKYPPAKDIQHLYYKNIVRDSVVTDLNKIQELNLLKYKLLEFKNDI